MRCSFKLKLQFSVLNKNKKLELQCLKKGKNKYFSNNYHENQYSYFFIFDFLFRLYFVKFPDLRVLSVIYRTLP